MNMKRSTFTIPDVGDVAIRCIEMVFPVIESTMPGTYEFNIRLTSDYSNSLRYRTEKEATEARERLITLMNQLEVIP